MVFSATGLTQRTNVLNTSINQVCNNVALELIVSYGYNVNYTQPWTCTYVVFNQIVVRRIINVTVIMNDAMAALRISIYTNVYHSVTQSLPVMCNTQSLSHK